MASRDWTFERVSDAVAIATERALGLALIVAIALNFVNVVGRYLTGFTLTGADEIEVYILIWIAFLGAAVVSWRRQHLRMDVLLGALPASVQAAVAVLETCVLAAVTLFVAFQSYRYVEKIYALGAVSDIARVPTWLPHSAVVVGFGTMALIVLIRIVQKIARAPGTTGDRAGIGPRQ
jgi:TRAP-type C4-dicarboxylate transport system permease small subunit